MASMSIQQFYSEIVTRGRRNVPTFRESQRDATAMAERVTSVEVYRV